MKSRQKGLVSLTEERAKTHLERRLLGDVVKPPSVSIIITNFNYRRFIFQAIDSVRSQTYKKFDCVIIDDCSTDESFVAISEYLADLSDERFRCIRLGNNLGQMGAIKAGLENSTGNFVAILDADDKLLPNFIEEHVNAHLNGAFSAAMTASDTLQIDENDELLESTFHTHMKHRSDISGPGGVMQPVLAQAFTRVSGEDISIGCPNGSPMYRIDAAHDGWFVVAMSSLMFRRSVLELIVPTQTDKFRICADYYLVKFAHLISGTITIWSQLSCFRMHRTNNFSKNAVLGGRHNPGNFTKHMRWEMEQAIPHHIIENFDRFSEAIGIDACVHEIRRRIPRKSIYQAIRHKPSLVAVFAKGRPTRFLLKYRYLYRLLKKRDR